MPASAQARYAGIKQMGTLSNVLALTGVAPRLESLQVEVAETEVKYKFAVDGDGLRGFLASAAKWAGP